MTARHARADLGGEFPGETWDEAHARGTDQDRISQALADARADRGQWLTVPERALLTHITRFGAAAYPITKRRTYWSYDWPSAPLYRTRREAVCAFTILYGSWSHLASREACEIPPTLETAGQQLGAGMTRALRC